MRYTLVRLSSRFQGLLAAVVTGTPPASPGGAEIMAVLTVGAGLDLCSLSSWNPLGYGKRLVLIIPMIRMRKWRLREGKELAQGHTAPKHCPLLPPR